MIPPGLEEAGYAVVRDEDALRLARVDPWACAERLLGARPRMVEKQFIRPVEGAKTFAAGVDAAPLHTDSQQYAGRPPRVQVMVCEAQAERGGETVLVDTRALLARLTDVDPSLHAALHETPRRMRFYFGDLFCPTVVRDGTESWFTHPPVCEPDDPVGQRLQAALREAPLVLLHPRAGDVLVVDNHRMLHGRRAFQDRRRAFLRLLVWTGPPVDEAERRLLVVLEMVRGVPPSRLAAREGVPEALLYRWRDAALLGRTE